MHNKNVFQKYTIDKKINNVRSKVLIKENSNLTEKSTECEDDCI